MMTVISGNSLGSVIIFLKKLKQCIQQGDMKLNKSNNINFYIITK